MSLLKLLQLAPPPINPIYTGSEKDFLQIENQIGSRLPSDYKEYIQHYGDCMWFRHIYIFLLLSSLAIMEIILFGDGINKTLNN
ncbi:MAG: SMI1/KNR4 family protein [Planctomycetaceae bacterium]|jgi:hypothetical protein|nr:SMI1/KNR4 family protein [Planctomycetaceae bacterium]